MTKTGDFRNFSVFSKINDRLLAPYIKLLLILHEQQEEFHG